MMRFSLNGNGFRSGRKCIFACWICRFSTQRLHKGSSPCSLRISFFRFFHLWQRRNDNRLRRGNVKVLWLPKHVAYDLGVPRSSYRQSSPLPVKAILIGDNLYVLPPNHVGYHRRPFGDRVVNSHIVRTAASKGPLLEQIKGGWTKYAHALSFSKRENESNKSNACNLNTICLLRCGALGERALPV